MAARTSMSGLIAAVRTLIFDPSGSTAVLTDQQIQDALDHTRQTINMLELAPAMTINAGGSVSWLDYFAEVGSAGLGDWETDAVLKGYPSFATLSPASSDYIVGHWTFDTSVYAQGQRPPVYIVGKVYDRYLAASECLEAWAAQLKLKFSFSSDSQKFNLKEQFQSLLELSRTYKAKSKPRTAQMVRTDTPKHLWQRGGFDTSRTTF